MEKKQQFDDNNGISTKRENTCDYKESKDTVKALWYNYATSSTLHCLPRAANVQSSKWRRMIWFAFLATMFAMVLWQSSIQIQRYLEFGTLLKEYSVYDEEMEFPAITVCDINILRKSDVADPHVQDVLRKIYMEKPINESYFENLNKTWLKEMNLSNIFYNTKPEFISDRLLLCLWNREQIDCNTYFSPITTRAGRCALLNVGQLPSTSGIGSGMGLTLIMHSNTSDYLISTSAGSGFRVLPHEKTESPDIRELGMILSPGTANAMSVKKSQISFLRPPFPAFGDEYCLDTTASNFISPLKYITRYSFESCRLDCFTKHVTGKCGCTDVFMPGRDIPICDVYTLVTCYRKASDDFFSNSTCECLLPCERTAFSTKLSQSSFPHEGYMESSFPDINISVEYLRQNGLLLEVFLENKVYTRREQIREFTDSDLVASIGGFMGLFIGASFGTILELLEFFVDLIIKIFKRARGKAKLDIS